MTTPGATKFYRSNGKPAVSKQQFSLKTGAVFEWFPQETILFEGAVARINTIIDLEPGAFFTGWEILCMGGPAIKKRFDTGALTSTLVVRQAGVPLLWERLDINGKEDLDASAGLRGFPVSAVFLSTGVTRTIFEELRCHIETKQHMLFGITLLDQLLVARYLGDSPEKAKDFFLGLWKRLRPLITGREACLPRIWNT
jgi:urease accessory protein